MALEVTFNISALSSALTDARYRVAKEDQTEVGKGLIDVPANGEVHIPMAGKPVVEGEWVNCQVDDFDGANYLTTKGALGWAQVTDDGLLGDYLYVWLQTGQSLSTGTTDASNPVVNTGSLPGAFLYSGIPARSLGDTTADANSVATTSVYQESVRETNGYAAINYLKTALGGSSKYLFAPHGKGGASLSDLSPPSVMFDNGTLEIGAATERATEIGLPVKIPALFWIQGESNQATDRESYITDLRALHDQYIALAQAETGQADLPIIIEQTGNGSSEEIAKTLYEYTKRYDDAYFSTPKYFLNRLFYSIPTDRTHLNAQGYMIQGEYEAMALERLIKTGESKALEPTSYVVVGNTIEIEMNVPTPPMIIDTTTLPAAPNYGVKFTTPLNKVIEVTQISLNGNKIIVDIGQPPMENGIIDFGHTLNDSGDNGGYDFACANIRDSNSTQSISGMWTLYNWLPELDRTLSVSDGAIVGNGNLWVYPDVEADGTEGSSLIGGVVNYSGLTTGNYLVEFDVIANTSGGEMFRLRVGEQSVYESETGSYSVPVTVADVSVPRLAVYGFTGFSGVISNIRITEV